MEIVVTAEALHQLADELEESGSTVLVTTDDVVITLKAPRECAQCGAPCRPNEEFCDGECWQRWHDDHSKG